MRKSHFAEQLDPVAAPRAIARRRPLADPVERQDRGLLERRRKERASGVGFVVLGEDVMLLVTSAEPSVHLSGQVQLLPEPEWDCFEKRSNPRGRVAQVGFEQALELQKGLVVKPDVIELARVEVTFTQAVLDRAQRKGMIVL